MLGCLAIPLTLLVIGVIAGLITHRPRPDFKTGPEADAIARRMEAAVNQPAWDTTYYLRWTFAGRNHYTWDRQREMVEVRWGKKRVLLHTPTQTGVAYQNGALLDPSDRSARKAVEAAWKKFTNDSFWLIAPSKAFDPGTKRGTVDGADDRVLIKYESGGVTPGDAYLWLLDETDRPAAWRLWVKIIPIGGLKTTWEDWQTLSTGAHAAGSHQLGFLKLKLTGIQGASQPGALNIPADLFGPLEEKL